MSESETGTPGCVGCGTLGCAGRCFPNRLEIPWDTLEWMSDPTGPQHEPIREPGQCVICAFETESDDAVFGQFSGHLVCLRCDTRMRGTAKRMPRKLMLQISAAVNTTE